MKRFISLLLILALIIACVPIISLQANAATVASGDCGKNLTWTLDNEGLLRISGTGAMSSFLVGGPPWDEFAADIKCAVISDGVTSIVEFAFQDCSSLTSVTIPDSVTSIGNYAFYKCSNLTNITIPDGVTSIGDHAFYDCDSLTGIWVDEENINYSCDNYGVLFNKDKTTLIQAPSGIIGSYTIPDSVTGIGEEAFYDCDSLISIEIPDSVTGIGEEAFCSCSSLTSVTIPDSVTSIGEAAFSFCWGLTDVYYAGTQAQWNEIAIGADNEDLTDATIHYNYIHDYSLIPSVKVDATCTEIGYTQYTCIYGETYHADYVPALGHDIYNVGTLKEPTCTEKGSVGGQCTRCKEEIVTATVAALGHSMVVLQAKDATCTEDGSTVGSKCERCDYYGITPTVIPATGHSFADGACSGCGLEGVALHKQGDAETYYNTLEEALAVTDGTIQLLADVTADVVNLNANVTLDLNGYTLTADSVSGKVMDSQDGEGLIKVSAQSAVLSSNDDQLILWDNATGNAGYRVFNYTFTNMGLDAHGDDESESAKYGATVKSVWSDLVFTNSYAYTLAASTYSGLQVGFELSWTPDGGETASKTFNFNAATVGAWGTAEEGNTGAENYCFYIRVTGFEELLSSGAVTVKPVVSTAFNAAETAVTEMRYEYTEPNPGGLEYEVGFGVVPQM